MIRKLKLYFRRDLTGSRLFFIAGSCAFLLIRKHTEIIKNIRFVNIKYRIGHGIVKFYKV